MANNLVFIKLGGSAITDKNVERSLDRHVLDNCAREISELCKTSKILIGHGGGSFAHPVAAKYNVKAGLKHSSIEGFIKTRRAVEDLGKIVMQSLKSAGVPAVYVPTFACALMKGGKLSEIQASPIEALLASGKVPVLPGDAVLDSKQVFSIVSTEMILNHLAKKLQPKSIIIGTNVDGVLDENGKIVPEINSKNLEAVLEKVGEAGGKDVTGGMRHKILEIFELAKLGCEVRIINLKKQGILTKAALGGEVPCTRIRK